MYEKRYREWEADKCYYKDDNNQKVDITLQSLKLSVMEADYLITFSYSMVVATGCLTALILIEWWLIVKFQNDGVSKQALDFFLFVRRTLSLIVFIIWSIGCYLIFNFDGKLI